jgi:hypothetical protein
MILMTIRRGRGVELAFILFEQKTGNNKAMEEYSIGDRVRIDIPDESDVDYEEFHGQHGTIISVLQDDASTIISGEEDSQLYRVEFDSGETMDFRLHDLRPPLE